MKQRADNVYAIKTHGLYRSFNWDRTTFTGQQQQFHFGFGQRAFLGGYGGALDHLNRSADFAMTLSRMPNCQSKYNQGDSKNVLRIFTRVDSSCALFKHKYV